MRILLSGFEPWGMVEDNPSWDAAAPLDGAEIGGARVHALRLPVAWGRAADMVCDAAGRLRPSAVLMCGLASGAASIRLEQRFVNVRRGRDADGAQAQDAPVVDGGPAALDSVLPLPEILDALRASGIPAVLSSSAGAYVCNATAYAVRHRLPGLASGFAHVPATPAMIARRQARMAAEGRDAADAPSMALETISAGLRVAVEAVVRAAAPSADPGR